MNLAGLLSAITIVLWAMRLWQGAKLVLFILRSPGLLHGDIVVYQLAIPGVIIALASWTLVLALRNRWVLAGVAMNVVLLAALLPYGVLQAGGI